MSKMGSIDKIQGALFASSLCDALVSRYYGKNKLSQYIRVAVNLYTHINHYSKYTDIAQAAITSVLDNNGIYEEELAEELARRVSVLRGYTFSDLYKIKTNKPLKDTKILSDKLNYEITLARANVIALLYPEMSIALSSLKSSSSAISSNYENYFVGKVLIVLIQSYLSGKTDLEVAKILSRLLKSESISGQEGREDRTVAMDKIKPLVDLLSELVLFMKDYDPNDVSLEPFEYQRTKLLNSKDIFGYELAVALFYFIENKERNVSDLAADINWHQNCDIGIVAGVSGALWGARNGTLTLPCNLEATLESHSANIDLAGRVYDFSSVKEKEIEGKFAKLVKKVKGFLKW